MQDSDSYYLIESYFYLYGGWFRPVKMGHLGKNFGMVFMCTFFLDTFTTYLTISHTDLTSVLIGSGSLEQLKEALEMRLARLRASYGSTWMFDFQPFWPGVEPRKIFEEDEPLSRQEIKHPKLLYPAIGNFSSRRIFSPGKLILNARILSQISLKCVIINVIFSRSCCAYSISMEKWIWLGTQTTEAQNRH